MVTVYTAKIACSRRVWGPWLANAERDEGPFVALNYVCGPVEMKNDKQEAAVVSMKEAKRRIMEVSWDRTYNSGKSVRDRRAELGKVVALWDTLMSIVKSPKWTEVAGPGGNHVFIHFKGSTDTPRDARIEFGVAYEEEVVGALEGDERNTESHRSFCQKLADGIAELNKLFRAKVEACDGPDCGALERGEFNLVECMWLATARRPDFPVEEISACAVAASIIVTPK